MDVDLLFPSSVIRTHQPQFIEAAKVVLEEKLSKVERNSWNVCQSEPIFDKRLDGLLEFIAKTSHEVLTEQGYNMQTNQTSVTEFWGQEFTRNAQHIEHVHPRAQISGFYFVEVPENSSMPTVFDPRIGKRQINMIQANMENVTYASEQIMFKPVAGEVLLMNSWLPHGFTRHESDSPLRFIHFNVDVEPYQGSCQVEVV